MVVKTDICSFSEFRIYPGHGQKFCARDGRLSIFISKKAAKFYIRKVKAQKITWTITWRRHWKKVKADEAAKKRRRRAAKVQRGIIGVTLDEIKRRRNEKPEEREAQRNAALKEIKDRKKKIADSKRGTARPGDKAAKKQVKAENVAQKKAATQKGKGKK
eukprot:TRINITY_DN0_c1066_g1_i2.p1 TRINITY_DN0_c1066_g1~~TRINITY_DN0_c1066_g1_i2.p1  ORF type:complete len:160 (+),score=71.48 TRINITY_DN0_c1066_g1_i2:34-513(+)